MALSPFRQGWIEGSPKISYTEIGAGPPVVFFHGIGGNQSNWEHQQRALSDICTTISWDARGYGNSEDYEGPLQFSLFSDDLLRLLDSRGIEKAHFVGLSMGARILMDFYAISPKRVATLTLCDCFFSYDKSLSPEKQIEFIELRQRPLKEGKTLDEIAPDLIQSLVSPRCSLEARKILHESIVSLHVESYLKTIEATTKFELKSALEDFHVPVQLIFGELDLLTPPEIGHSMKAKMPNAQFAIIEGAGHLSNLEQPGDFSKVLREFIQHHLNLAKI